MVSLVLPLKETLSEWVGGEAWICCPSTYATRKTNTSLPLLTTGSVLPTAQELSLHVHLPTLQRTSDRVATVTKIWERKLGFDARREQECPDWLRGRPKLLFNETMHSLQGVKGPGLEAKH